MKNTTSTFYAVRIVRHFVNSDRDPEVYWVCRHSYGQGSRHWSLGSQKGAERFRNVTKAKAALKYACVRDELDRGLVADHETIAAMTKKHGNDYYASHRWRSKPRLKVRHEAEVVKITEHVTYDEPEVLDSLPKRSALEQLAREADENPLRFCSLRK